MTFQTLFCELRLEDERVAPRFSRLWNSAEAQIRPRAGFKLSYVVIALLTIGLLPVLFLFRIRPSIQLKDAVGFVTPATTRVDDRPGELERPAIRIPRSRLSNRVRELRRMSRLAEQRRPEMLALREAEMLNALAVANWQSPTAMLMESPADDVLSELPELYRSVYEVNSFLADTQN